MPGDVTLEGRGHIQDGVGCLIACVRCPQRREMEEKYKIVPCTKARGLVLGEKRACTLARGAGWLKKSLGVDVHALHLQVSRVGTSVMMMRWWWRTRKGKIGVGEKEGKDVGKG